MSVTYFAMEQKNKLVDANERLRRSGAAITSAPPSTGDVIMITTVGMVVTNLTALEGWVIVFPKL